MYAHTRVHVHIIFLCSVSVKYFTSWLPYFSPFEPIHDFELAKRVLTDWEIWGK